MGEPGTVVLEIVHEASWAMVTVAGIPNRPEETARVFRVIADLTISVDMIARRPSTRRAGCSDVLFTLADTDAAKALSALEWERDSAGFDAPRLDERVGRISLIGTGLRSNPSFAASFFAVLSAAGVGVRLSSLSESRICVVCDHGDTAPAVEALRRAYRPRSGARLS